LQAFLLSVLRRQAAFSRNRQLLAEIESDLSLDATAHVDVPDAAVLLAQERTVARDATNGVTAGSRASA
jgi:hypothetical protein